MDYTIVTTGARWGDPKRHLSTRLRSLEPLKEAQNLTNKYEVQTPEVRSTENGPRAVSLSHPPLSLWLIFLWMKYYKSQPASGPGYDAPGFWIVEKQGRPRRLDVYSVQINRSQTEHTEYAEGWGWECGKKQV